MCVVVGLLQSLSIFSGLFPSVLQGVFCLLWPYGLFEARLGTMQPIAGQYYVGFFIYF